MVIPPWLAVAVAVLVAGFGAYRIKLGLTQTVEQEAEAKKRGGLYGMGKRFHLFVGAIYVLMGVALGATAFGWQPFGGASGSASTTLDTPPVKLVPIDQAPGQSPGSASPQSPSAQPAAKP